MVPYAHSVRYMFVSNHSSPSSSERRAAMSEVSFPGDGHDGEQPPPAVPARDGAPPGPPDDWEADAEMAAFIAGLDAGRARPPAAGELEGPASASSLGDAADVDLAGLAAMLG